MDLKADENTPQPRPQVRGLYLFTIVCMCFLLIGMLLGSIIGYDTGRMDGFQLGVNAATEYLRGLNGIPHVRPPVFQDIPNNQDQEL